MSNEDIILDILKRLIKLEKEVEELKKEKEVEVETEDLNVEVEETRVRTQFRNDIINMLKENNPDKKNIRVSNREEGSGITIEEQDGTKKSYILRTSNNIASDRSNGWFTVGESVVEKIINKDLNGIILYSYYDDIDKDILVIMNSEEFEGYMNKKGFENKDAKGRYHMYIKFKNKGIFEYRDGDIDISEYSNKFKV